MHIAIIMDGNRRWAVENGRNKFEGHQHGGEKLKELVNWCEEAKVKTITLHTFSNENFNRSEEEKTVLFNLFRIFLPISLRFFNINFFTLFIISLCPKLISTSWRTAISKWMIFIRHKRRATKCACPFS